MVQSTLDIGIVWLAFYGLDSLFGHPLQHKLNAALIAAVVVLGYFL